MTDQITLQMFQCGVLETTLENIKMNQGMGEKYAIPVPWFVVSHPRGNVLIDGGNAPECAVDAKRHWGGVSEVYWPVMTPEEGVLPQLEKHGIDPASITHVLQSHLHLDHTGAVAVIDRLPNAKVVATRTEYEYAHAPDAFASGGYIRADFIKEGVDWVLLDETDDGYDLFGDGAIRCWRTPGHAVGHQSFEVTVSSGTTYLLTIDAAYTTDHWNGDALPGFLASTVDTVRSVAKLHRIADRGRAVVVTGHDPDAWKGFEQAPHAYA